MSEFTEQIEIDYWVGVWPSINGPGTLEKDLLVSFFTKHIGIFFATTLDHIYRISIYYVPKIAYLSPPYIGLG